MFLRNYWYVGAYSEELKTEPLARTLLGEDVVMFRTDDGRVVVLEDRCAHRMMPLSKGRVNGDRIACCYHGLAFDGSGACVSVPRQQTPPTGLRVRSYPAEERYGAIWIWMGNPNDADPAAIFDCSLLDPTGSNGLHVYFHVNANYMFINDNLTDLLHVAFLHNPATRVPIPGKASSAIGNDSLAAGNLDVGEREGVIYGDWTWSSIEAPKTFKALAGIQGPADGWVLSRFQAPSFFINPIGFAEAGTGADQSPLEQGRGKFSFTLYQCITPETERTTHFFKLLAHDWTPEMVERGYQLVDNVNKEDIWAMELQQLTLDRNPLATMNYIHTDGAVVRMRRLLATLAAAE